MAYRRTNPDRSLARIGLVSAAIAALAASAPHAHAQRQEDDDVEARQITVQLVGSPTGRTLLEKAEQFAAQDRHVEAARAFDDLVEADGAMAIELEPGRYADASRWLADRLHDDPELERAYAAMVEQRVRAALADAERDPSAAATLRDLAVRYAATPGGLEAALRWAGVALEAADALTARRVLERIGPRIADDAQRVRWLALSAAAAMIQRDDDAFARYRTGLAERGADDRIAELNRWRQTTRRPDPPAAQHAPPTSGPVRAPAKPDAPAWSADLPLADVTGVPHMRRLEDGWARMPNGRVQAQWDPVYELTDRAPFAAPASLGPRVVVNNGQHITALDLATGKPAWSYADDPALLAAESKRRDINVVGWHIADVRSVALAADRPALFAVLGRMIGDPLGTLIADDRRRDPFARPAPAPAPNAAPNAAPAPQSPQRGSSSLVALDATTGALRWRLRPADLGDDWLDAAFHATPILDGPRVITLAHRIIDGEFQQTLLAAVDASTGRPIWQRRLVIVRDRVRGTIESHAAMSLAGDRLFVSDGLGFVASIDPLTGVADWITRPLAAPGNEKGSDARLAATKVRFERRIDPPIATPAGLVVPMRLRGIGAVLLDPDTGVMRRALADAPWSDAESITQVAGAPLVIGAGAKHAALLDPATLAPKWSTALPDITPRPEPRDPQRDRFGRIRGVRAEPTAPPIAGPVLAGDSITLVIADRLIALDRATGALTDAGPIGDPCWPLPLRDRLILTSNRAVRAY